MFEITVEIVLSFLGIMFSALVQCGIRELIDDPLPGDHEKQALLTHMRAMNAHSRQHTRAILAELAGLTAKNCCIEHRKDGTNEDQSTSRNPAFPTPHRRRPQRLYTGQDASRG